MALPEPVTLHDFEAHPGGTVAAGVSFDDYMQTYAAFFCEWLDDGEVIKMPPVGVKHDDLFRYLIRLLEIFFELRPVGSIRVAPFVMKLERAREPDIQIILNTNPHPLRETYLDGPADICIEIISPESVARDRGEKFSEYEAGGVREYWLLDPQRRDPNFYRLNEEGIYVRQTLDEQDCYTTPLLPGLLLHVPTLWQDDLPGPVEIVQKLLPQLQDRTP